MRALATVAAPAFVGVLLAGLLSTVALHAQTDEVVRPDAANQVERNVVEYESDRLHIVAAQHYSWGDHDPKWLLGHCPDHQFRFFVDSGIRQSVVYANRVAPCVRGDLYFASPTGAWERGTYTLIIGGDTDVRLPIEIE